MARKVENKPNQDQRNILKDKTCKSQFVDLCNYLEIPQWWSKPDTKEVEKKTRTKLLQVRKQDAIPHLTFDLDGDGIVGGRDLVIAKHFDKDMDGRLNTAEKANAIKAIAEGFENKFIWGIEQSGPNAMHRLLQKRGQFVNCEDFAVVGSTYPTHPLTK